MALLTVTSLLSDPLFSDPVTRNTRASTVSSTGRNVLVETTETKAAVVQGATPDNFQRVPDGVNLLDSIVVWWPGELNASNAVGGYSDTITWRGRVYQVIQVMRDYINFDGPDNGYTKGLCVPTERGVAS